jgi:hypothetical protein
VAGVVEERVSVVVDWAAAARVVAAWAVEEMAAAGLTVREVWEAVA